MTDSDLLKKAIHKRSDLFLNKENTCLRLFNAGGDAIKGITIDLFGEYLLVQHFDDDADDNKFLKIIYEQSSSLLLSAGIELKGILLKNRTKIKAEGDMAAVRVSSLVIGSHPPENYIVKQNGLSYKVDLISGQNTGLFLDMREVRDDMIKFYPGMKSMLNLFCYTGAFSVHAMKNGLNSSINIDISKTVLNRAKDNFELNAIKIDTRDFIRGDSSEWINKFIKIGKTFDLIVFDPPTFSRNKDKSFSVKNDYIKSLELLKKLAPGGKIFTTINSASIDKKDYISFHPSGFKLLRFWNESPDFPFEDAPYLKAALWSVKT